MFSVINLAEAGAILNPGLSVENKGQILGRRFYSPEELEVHKFVTDFEVRLDDISENRLKSHLFFRHCNILQPLIYGKITTLIINRS
jgi:hypothetical protein